MSQGISQHPPPPPIRGAKAQAWRQQGTKPLADDIYITDAAQNRAASLGQSLVRRFAGAILGLPAPKVR
jgi:hypothetical protein